MTLQDVASDARIPAGGRDEGVLRSPTTSHSESVSAFPFLSFSSIPVSSVNSSVHSTEISSTRFHRDTRQQTALQSKESVRPPGASVGIDMQMLNCRQLADSVQAPYVPSTFGPIITKRKPKTRRANLLSCATRRPATLSNQEPEAVSAASEAPHRDVCSDHRNDGVEDRCASSIGLTRETSDTGSAFEMTGVAATGSSTQGYTEPSFSGCAVGSLDRVHLPVSEDDTSRGVNPSCDGIASDVHQTRPLASARADCDVAPSAPAGPSFASPVPAVLPAAESSPAVSTPYARLPEVGQPGRIDATEERSRTQDDSPFGDLVASPSVTRAWSAADNLFLALLMYSETAKHILETGQAAASIANPACDVEGLTQELERLQHLQNTHIAQENFIEAERVDEDIKQRKQQLYQLEAGSQSSPFTAYMASQTKFLDIANDRFTAIGTAIEDLCGARSDAVAEANSVAKREAARLAGSVEKLKFECDRLNMEEAQIEKQYATIDTEYSQVEDKIAQQTQQYNSAREDALIRLRATDEEVLRIQRELELKLRERHELQDIVDECDEKITVARSKFQKQLGRIQTARATLDAARVDVATEWAQLHNLHGSIRDGKQAAEVELCRLAHEIGAISVALHDARLVLLAPAQQLRELRSYCVGQHTELLGPSDASCSGVRIMEALRSKREQLEKLTHDMSQLRNERTMLQRRLDEASTQKRAVVAVRLFREAATLTQEIRSIEVKLEELEAKLTDANASFQTFSAEIHALEEQEQGAREEAERWNRSRATQLIAQVRVYAKTFTQQSEALLRDFCAWKEHRSRHPTSRGPRGLCDERPAASFTEYIQAVDRVIQEHGLDEPSEVPLDGVDSSRGPDHNREPLRPNFVAHPLVERVAESANTLLDDFAAEAAECEWWQACCAQWQETFRLSEEDTPRPPAPPLTAPPTDAEEKASIAGTPRSVSSDNHFCPLEHHGTSDSTRDAFSVLGQLKACADFVNELDELLTSMPVAKCYEDRVVTAAAALSAEPGEPLQNAGPPAFEHSTEARQGDRDNAEPGLQQTPAPSDTLAGAGVPPAVQPGEPQPPTHRCSSGALKDDDDDDDDDATPHTASPISLPPAAPSAPASPRGPAGCRALGADELEEGPATPASVAVDGSASDVKPATPPSTVSSGTAFPRSLPSPEQVRDTMIRALEAQVDEAVRDNNFEKASELDRKIEALKSACAHHSSAC